MTKREFKFRVWDIKKGVMYYPDLIAISRLGAARVSYSQSFSPQDCIIQQYTGVKDKDGREIYEGDIIELEQDEGVDEFPFYVKRIGEVIYYNGGFIGVLDAPLSSFYDGCEKIIGNIFENKNLLETKNENG